MATQSFNLDPSVATLPLSLLRKRYEDMTPEERRMAGLLRPATQDEFDAAQQGAGAPADFAGRVLPNPNNVQISDDTDSGVPALRLPNGVSAITGAYTGTPKLDTSNPATAQIIPAQMQTIAAKTTPGNDFDQFMQQQAAPPANDFDQFMQQQQAPEKKTEEPSFWDDPKAFLESRAKKLQGEAQNQMNQAVGVESQGKALYSRLGHSLLSLAPETAALVDKLVAGGMDWKNALTVASGVVDPAIPAAAFMAQGTEQLTGVSPGVKAGDTSPDNVQNALLAGSAVAGGAGAVETPKTGSTAELIKNSRKPIVKKAAAAPIVEPTPPELTTEARTLPGQVGAERIYGPKPTPAKPIPARNGLLLRGEVEAPIAEDLEGVTSSQTESAGETPGEHVPEETAPAKKTLADLADTSPKNLDKLLKQATGAKEPPKVVPGVKMKNQAAAAGVKLPEGFTPTESSVLKGYQYNSATQELDGITNTGGRYRHAQVSPEQFEQFEKDATDSPGKAWNNLRNAPGVTPLGKVDAAGTLQPRIKPQAMRSVSVDPETGEPEFTDALDQKKKNLSDFIKPSAEAQPAAAKTAAAEPDLGSTMQQMLDQVKSGKKLSDLNGVPKSAYDQVISEAMKEGPAWTPKKAKPIVDALNKNEGVEFEARGSVGEGRSTANDLDLYQKQGSLSDAHDTLKELGFKYNGKTPHGETWTNGAQHIDLWDSEHEPIKGYKGKAVEKQRPQPRN